MTHYYTFLSMFGREHSFQTFDDKGKNRGLIKQLHGTMQTHFHQLVELNKKGAGVFFTVNETNLKGRTTEHIQRVRAVFIDLDGTPLPHKFALDPHFIVNTSPQKYHCYWLVDDMPKDLFPLYQQALAERFNSDPKVKDLPRVMRIAGFFHCKKTPFPIKILKRSLNNPYKKNEIKEAFDLKRPKVKEINYEPTLLNGKYAGSYMAGSSQGNRHENLIKMLVAIRLRGESYEYMKAEAINFANTCNPPETHDEVIFQLNDIWERYDPVKRLSKKSD